MIQFVEPITSLSSPNSWDSTQFHSEITVYELPVFDVLLKKHIPSKNIQIFSDQFFRFPNSTPLNTQTHNNQQQSSEAIEANIIYDPISNKLISTNRPFTTEMPVAEQAIEYNSHKTIIEKYLSQRVSSSENFISKSGWITFLDLSILIFVVFGLKALGRFLQPIVSSMFVFNQSSRLFFERNVVVNRLGSVLNVLFFIEVGFLLTLFSDYYGIRIMNLPLWQHFFVYLGILVVAFFLKNVLNHSIGYFLDFSDIVLEYRFQSNLYLKLSALLILPMVLILPYVPNFVIEPVFQIILGCFLLSYLLRIERLIRVTVNKRFSIFYLFLYLCTVELGPAFLIVVTKIRQ